MLRRKKWWYVLAWRIDGKFRCMVREDLEQVESKHQLFRKVGIQSRIVRFQRRGLVSRLLG